ncbi:sulfatase family protein [Haloferula rosea]|uniref:Sulfatase n=1 Tax=Haloferula rosea TaxID=490093 RepID=A0A934VFR0_9BACT|nr:sulfatase [Haloferula rosea]MBK1827311.1 sulfatase [Haloferula rosea]
MRPVILACLSAALLLQSESKETPNVLWITLEDTSPHFIGCYGDSAARTPNIDGLADRGIRFTRAFANAPVCSAARSTIITGTLNEVLGTGHHRSAMPIPDRIKGFPTFLREANYYTSNNYKTDYSTSDAKRLIQESWNESSGQAGWWKRGKEQPFFSVFNFNDTHQSRTMTWPYAWYRENIFNKTSPERRVSDKAFAVPPFYPDTPEIRRHFARVYNCIARTDEQVGDLLARLESEGLSDDTIIFCYADHGEAMPRGKANPIALGYRVPFIISIPEKWKHLNPWGPPGSTSDELICFDDLGPTMLSLVGRKPAPWMTGRPLMGEHRSATRPYIFCSRNRIDESAGCSRSITDGRFIYTRHFLPAPELQYVRYFDVSDISQELRGMHREGELNEVQTRLFEDQPHEVLYDLESDPWEIENLAADPAHAEKVAHLRSTLFEHIITSRDIMLCPEYELIEISRKSTPYETGQAAKPKELRHRLYAADLASRPGVHREILKLARSESPVITYWAATALGRVEGYPRDPFKLEDFPYPPARIEFAAGRYHFDQDPAAKAELEKFARSFDPRLRLHALQRIQSFGQKAADFTEVLEHSLKSRDLDCRNSAEMSLHMLDQRPILEPGPR